jgi:hypothetical protein
MKQSVIDAFVTFTERFEGRVNSMYLDLHIPDPLVTIGIGNLIDPMSVALGLPFVMPDGTRATQAQIASGWQAVKNRTDLAKNGFQAFEALTPLRLTDDAVADLVRSRMETNEQFLVKRFPDWDSWPADAQLAMHSISWAAGAGINAPHLQAALTANPRRFDIAAGPDGDANKLPACRGESWLHDATIVSAPGVTPVVEKLTNPGLRPRNLANKLLFANAEQVESQGLDPNVLHWPNAVPAAPMPAAAPPVRSV